MKTLIKLTLLTFFGFTQSWAFTPADVAGIWMHDGKRTKISVGNNYNYIFCNEQQDCAEGIIRGGGIIGVDRWNVTGKINRRGNVISWDNGTVWVKSHIVKKPLNVRFRKLSGPWMHKGKPTSIILSSNGRDFTITNEIGHSDSGYINEQGNLVLPTLNIIGHLNHHGRKIEWSNGTVWFKR